MTLLVPRSLARKCHFYKESLWHQWTASLKRKEKSLCSFKKKRYVENTLCQPSKCLFLFEIFIAKDTSFRILEFVIKELCQGRRNVKHFVGGKLIWCMHNSPDWKRVVCTTKHCTTNLFYQSFFWHLFTNSKNKLHLHFTLLYFYLNFSSATRDFYSVILISA